MTDRQTPEKRPISADKETSKLNRHNFHNAQFRSVQSRWSLYVAGRL